MSLTNSTLEAAQHHEFEALVNRPRDLVEMRAKRTERIVRLCMGSLTLRD
jgi:hypothetical protein